MRRKSIYSKRKKNFSSILPIVLVLAIAAAVALVIALIWQRSEDNGTQHSSSSSQLSSLEPESSSSVPEVSSSEISSSESSSTPVVDDNPSSVPWAVKKSAPVSSSYFSDAIFLGDSITTGISLYEIMDTNVVAHKGINIQTALDKAVIDSPDGPETLVQASTRYPDAKIYIMLGSNGIAWIEKDLFIDFYSQFIDQVKAAHPNSIIYIQSILPVTKWKSENEPEFANTKIDEYNLAIAELAQEKGCYYLDVAQAFKDEYGNLPDDASPVDGMHFGSSYYIKWFDYLKAHTVPDEEVNG